MIYIFVIILALIVVALGGYLYYTKLKEPESSEKITPLYGESSGQIIGPPKSVNDTNCEHRPKVIIKYKEASVNSECIDGITDIIRNGIRYNAPWSEIMQAIPSEFIDLLDGNRFYKKLSAKSRITKNDVYANLLLNASSQKKMEKLIAIYGPVHNIRDDIDDNMQYELEIPSTHISDGSPTNNGIINDNAILSTPYNNTNNALLDNII